MSMRSIYRKIAKMNGVSVAEVRHDIKSAIDQAYQSTANDEITAMLRSRVPQKADIPTPEEFIRFAEDEARRRMKK
ncbi:MAG: sporulation initiation factor Spo0A C-terminal domain-containing protein [Oscillospiraceae bacterium]